MTHIVDLLQRSFDKQALAISVIQEEHRMIHDGFLYTASHAFTDLPDDGTLDILLTVPEGAHPHLRSWTYALSDAPVVFGMHEGSIVTAPGTPVPTHNNNRNSANESAQTVVTADPNLAGGDTVLDFQYVPDPGGRGRDRPGTRATELAEEWILRDNEVYVLRMVNISGGPITGSITIMFYEIGPNILSR